MLKTMKRRLKGRCLPGLLLVAIFLLVPQASQAQETVIVTYTASPEPLRSRLQAWISARFLLWPELMDVSSGAQVDFAAAKQIFVYGMGSESPPPSFLSGLRTWVRGAPDRYLVWIGSGGEAFDFSEWGFQPGAEEHTVDSTIIDYVGKDSTLVQFDLHQRSNRLAAILDGARAKSDATWGGPQNHIIVSGTRDSMSGRVLWVGFNVTQGLSQGTFGCATGAHLPFMDLLHEVFPGGSPSWASDTKRMFVRFEDVHAKADFSPDPAATTSIYRAAQWLHDQDVPFTLAVIPVYAKPTPSYDYSHISPLVGLWTDTASPYDPTFRQKVIDTLKLEPKATVVAHGMSHQESGSISGEGFEFCAQAGDDCSSYYGVEYARGRVDSAIRELVEAGLGDPAIVGTNRIWGWETPHYAASDEVRHRVFENRFNFVFENGWWESWFPALADQPASFQFMPYTLSHYGTTYLNAYHSYVHGDSEEKKSEVAAQIVADAAKLSKLRHRVESGFFFHAHLVDRKYLETIILGMKTQGWTFPPLSSVVQTPVLRIGRMD
jgi:hypothetical protein